MCPGKRFQVFCFSANADWVGIQVLARGTCQSFYMGSIVKDLMLCWELVLKYKRFPNLVFPLVRGEKIYRKVCVNPGMSISLCLSFSLSLFLALALALSLSLCISVFPLSLSVSFLSLSLFLSLCIHIYMCTYTSKEGEAAAEGAGGPGAVLVPGAGRPIRNGPPLLPQGLGTPGGLGVSPNINGPMSPRRFVAQGGSIGVGTLEYYRKLN